jgi:hypothetical protein
MHMCYAILGKLLKPLPRHQFERTVQEHCRDRYVEFYDRAAVAYICAECHWHGHIVQRIFGLSIP